MPEASDRYVADRGNGVSTNMHPRENGEMILEPRDIMEGLGNFVEKDADGNPLGWRLGQPNKRDGRRVYVGTTGGQEYRQTHTPLDPTRPTHVLDYALFEDGPTPPTPETPLPAPLPRAKQPKLVKLNASILGYPASTGTSPYWFAWAFVLHGTLLTLAGPPVPFQLGEGQYFTVALPEDIPPGHQIAGLLSEPGKSRPEAPGPMWVQRIIDPTQFFLPSYPFTGPFRWDRQAATDNETIMDPPDEFQAKLVRKRGAARVGSFQVFCTFEDENGGETTLSTYSKTIKIEKSDKYSQEANEETGQEQIIAGRGAIEIQQPPTVPLNATGWRVRIYQKPIAQGEQFTAGWTQVVDKKAGHGGEKPIPLSRTSIETRCWTGDEEPYGKKERIILKEDEPPSDNTTGSEDPEDAPEAPQVIGSARPAPGQDYYIRTVDTLRGRESLPCDTIVCDDLKDGEIMALVFLDEENEIPNGTFTETDSLRLPLHYTAVKTNGDIRMEDGECIIETTSSVSSATTTPSLQSLRMPVDPTETEIFDVEFDIDPPRTGVIAGKIAFILRQYNAAGVATDTTIGEATQPGEYKLNFTMNATGGTAPAWLSSTVEYSVLADFFSISGSNKNLKARLKKFAKRSRRSLLRKAARKRKKIEHHEVPGTVIQDPPEPPTPPDPTTPTPVPIPAAHTDRPLMLNSPQLYATGFTNNGNPYINPQLTQVTTGTATLTAAAAASMDPAYSHGLEAKKTTAGTLSSAYVEQEFNPEHASHAYRHSLGCWSLLRLRSLPIEGRITVRELANPDDGQWFARVDASQEKDVFDVNLTQNPTKAGNTTLNVAGAAHTVAVVAAQSVARLDLGTGPTAYGTMVVNLDGGSANDHLVPVGGTKHVHQITITDNPDSTGYIILTLNGVQHWIWVHKDDSNNDVGERIALHTFPGWTTSRNKNKVTLTATDPGPKSGTFSFNHNNTDVKATLLLIAAGTCETTAQTATRLAASPPPGWTAAVDGVDPTIVVYTCSSPGAKPAPSFSPSTSGITHTWTVTNPGNLDTKEQVAAKIRALSVTGYTITGTGATARFTATATGVKATTTYYVADTGLTADITYTTKGTNTDLILKVRDKDDNIEEKKLATSLTNILISDIDLTVSGAGTDRAVVTVWYRPQPGTYEHAARIEDLDLTDIPAGLLRFGVVQESSAAMTWTIDSDGYWISNRGWYWHRDHDFFGNWLGQIIGHYDKTYPVSQDLLLQDGSFAVLPGKQYTLSIYAKPDNENDEITNQLLVATGRTTNGSAEVLAVAGEIEPGTKAGWTEYTAPSFTVPPNCFRLELNSRDIAGGAFILQEAVLSPGATADRRKIYATSGDYEQMYDMTTPDVSETFHYWTNKRKLITAMTDVPEGTTISTLISSGPTDGGPWTTPIADHTLVPEDDFIRISFTATSTTGGVTPYILANNPTVEWDLKIASSRRMSTLLNGDRTELPGGAAFKSIMPYSKRNAATRYALPSGDLQDDPQLFDNVGHLPASKIWLFNTLAIQHLENNWRQLWAVEAYGNVHFVLLSGPPSEFVPQTTAMHEDPVTGVRYGIFEADLPYAQVLRVVPLA